MNRKSKNAGFSLIELMVVISIISAIALTALPRYAMFKIKAGRTEMLLNMKNMFTLAHSFHAEKGNFPAAIVFIGPLRDQDFPWQGCDPVNLQNELGFSFSREACLKLRYVYRFTPFGWHGLPNPSYCVSDLTCFSIRATSEHILFDDGDYFDEGSVSPTRTCKTYPGQKLYFIDTWTMFENGELVPYARDQDSDALINCFK